ncbi:Low temperature requirement protein LtrA [Saccharopolyspora antimicrobica]|uniref:Low temperature requirement protein LtrA n=1 Tax=Saccharopolyspora antimicrobica TaxID=455193 RepID=A0A1I4VYJ2_9PSEU|nr:low temperature requirement protein A [Saccharopolyspora antimicrobica]RKT87145.1 low temperature requirement protein LtrA [Saccharopolyspora antimicrobica]SFN06388.1 Low temperature requirement protein LtrA [Saccharopolyspora antimicrobica]
MSSAPFAERRSVAPLELFFDLIFVFAIGQLAEHLHAELSWRGAAETAVMLVAVLSTWALTSFDATFLGVDRAGTRRLVLVVMGLGLFMNAQITAAFTDRPWAFAVPLVTILLLTDITAAVSAQTTILRQHYLRVTAWAVVSIPLWLIGAAVDQESRLVWWAAAAVVDMAGVWLTHPLPRNVLSSQHLVFDAEHMVERIRLFIILQLGETVLTLGTAISAAPIDAPTVVTGLGVFVALVCLCASYFSGGEDILSRHVSATADRLRPVRRAVSGQYSTLAGLVILAVGAELAISHPTGQGSIQLGLLLFGGPILYVLTQAWWYYISTRQAWSARLVACLVCAAAGVAACWLPPLASVLILDTILVVLVLVLKRVHRRILMTMATDDA